MLLLSAVLINHAIDNVRVHNVINIVPDLFSFYCELGTLGRFRFPVVSHLICFLSFSYGTTYPLPH